MNDNTDLINNIYNVEAGTYKVYFNGCDLCYLFSIPILTLKYILSKDNSNLILNRVKDLKHEIIKISNQYYCDYNIELISEIKRKGAINIKGRKFSNYKYKEIYIKINNEEPSLIYKGNGISELKSFNSYIISRFLTYDKYFYIITPSGYGYYCNNKVRNTLRKYFKCEDGKIICMYNNKKEVAKLTLITEDKLQYSQELLQSLKLEIDNKEFTFYINRYKNYDYKKEYYFLVFHIHNHSIYGYEYLEDRYYNLSSWTFILKYVKQEIIKKFEEYKSQDIYTYLSINNNYCGLCTKIDNNYHETTYIALKIDEVFEDILDISLLKPVDEWNDEEINAKKEYYEKEYKDNIENNTNKDTKDNIEK